MGRARERAARGASDPLDSTGVVRGRRRVFALIGALLGCAAALAGCDAPAPPVESATTEALQPPVDQWKAMVEVEERIHALRPELDRLGRSLENLALPDKATRRLLDVAVETTDVAEAGGQEHDLPGWPIRSRAFALGQPSPPTASVDVALWRPLLDRVDWFESARFDVVSGRFVADGERFESELKLSARARLDNGEYASVSGRIDVTWQKRELLGDEAWLVAAWNTRRMEWLTSPRLLFREVSRTAIPSTEQWEAARRSRHEELVEARLTEGAAFRPPHEHFFQGSQDRHPGLAVTDIDEDGFDDLYVMARWGPNQLFVNQGDGRFEEQAEAYGLAIEDHSAAAIFADFDNDGDDDLFLGRTLEPSRYLENRVADEGRFVEQPAPLVGGAALPSLVSSVSAVDYDGDGWLDLYVSTYAAQMLVVDRTAQVRAKRAGQGVEQALLSAHLPEPDAEALYALSAEEDAHLYLSLPGPPNVLLRNRGDGRFEALQGEHPLRSFRNTYQATWTDYDLDGDDDVYLAHDFAPNQLLRNDGGGAFSDVTTATETADIGFGMGVSWGDYDGDGREDLYVSNMYSKAGKRVTAWFDDLDPRFEKMAGGNSLFRNTPDGFEKVSGEAPPAVPVEAAGWAWGGQFADWSNDGAIDLYVLSGYYSAPALVQSDVDI